MVKMRCWLADGSVIEVDNLTDTMGGVNPPHRLDGPAIEGDNGTYIWMKDGKFHREDGPAMRTFVGGYQYFLDDRVMTRLEHFRQSPHFQKLSPQERLYEYMKISGDEG